MLADFEISIHREERELRIVRVVVHDSVRALRSAATQNAKRWGKQDLDHTEVVGLCERFHMQHTNGTKDPHCATVRLAPPYLGIGIVSHELTHATVWIREIDNQFKDVPLTCENDEEFCWILGELVRRTVMKFYEKGVYPTAESDALDG